MGYLSGSDIHFFSSEEGEKIPMSIFITVLTKSSALVLNSIPRWVDFNVKSPFMGDSHHDLLMSLSTGIKPMQWYQGMFAFGWQAFGNPKCLGAKTIHCLYSFYF